MLTLNVSCRTFTLTHWSRMASNEMDRLTLFSMEITVSFYKWHLKKKKRYVPLSKVFSTSELSTTFKVYYMKSFNILKFLLINSQNFETLNKNIFNIVWKVALLLKTVHFQNMGVVLRCPVSFAKCGQSCWTSDTQLCIRINLKLNADWLLFYAVVTLSRSINLGPLKNKCNKQSKHPLQFWEL